MPEIRLPEPTTPDIFSFGFDRNLNKITTDQVQERNPLVYDPLQDKLNAILIGSGEEVAKANSKINVYRSVALGVDAGSTKVVAYDVKVFDVLSEFDLTNARFTPKNTGYYVVSAVVHFDTDVFNIEYAVQIRKNGNNIASVGVTPYGTTAKTFSLPISQVIYLLNTDYIDIRINNADGGASHNIQGGQTATYLSIHRLS